jgi:hypothetical protein
MIIKAVTHVHSKWSYDGSWNLSQIAGFFGKLGYGLVLMTEHDLTFDSERWEAYKKACSEESSKKILIVPGIEYSDADNIVHVMVWGVPEFLGKGLKTGSLLQEANAKNGICVMSHPERRNAWQMLDKSWIPFLHGIELWNRKFDGIVPSRKAVELLKANSGIMPFAGLDLHRANQIFPLSMRIEIKGMLTTESVFDSLRNSLCKPFAFGLPASYFSGGLMFSFAKTADSIRRKISGFIKR